MNQLLNGYLQFGLGIYSEIQTRNSEWKERILKEWENSKNYPRKKKKKVRKSLNLDWSIANWDPFKF